MAHVENEDGFQSKVQIPATSYRERLGLTTFINVHYQIRYCLRFKPMKC